DGLLKRWQTAGKVIEAGVVGAVHLQRGYRDFVGADGGVIGVRLDVVPRDRFVLPVIGAPARISLLVDHVLRDLAALARDSNSAHFTGRHVHVQHDAGG